MKIKCIYNNSKYNDKRNNHGNYFGNSSIYNFILQEGEYYLFEFPEMKGHNGEPLRLFYHVDDIEFDNELNEIQVW